MSTKVEQYIRNLLVKEGEAYTNDPKDSGGKTKWGITEYVARAYGYKGEMKNLTRSIAFNIYFQRYWIAPKFDKVEKLSPVLSERLFEFGVLAGPTVATAHLQRCLNVLNNGAVSYPDLIPDGVIGPMALEYLGKYLKNRVPHGEKVLIGMVVALQSVYLLELAERRPKDERFEYGWQLNRTIGPLLGIV